MWTPMRMTSDHDPSTQETPGLCLFDDVALRCGLEHLVM